jgi:hypothetical protein
MAKLSIKIPFSQPIKPKERAKIADALLTHIVGRTMAGLDRDNNKFAKYTKEYAKEKGVGTGDVDLLLSGEMLSELKVLSTSPKSIEIGYSGSKALIGKVEGNILGTYGQPEPIPGKARDFLGILPDDVQVIVESYMEEDFEDLTEDEIDKIARDAAREILGDINFDTEIDDGE